MKAIIIAILMALSLTGCATNSNYTAYADAKAAKEQTNQHYIAGLITMANSTNDPAIKSAALTALMLNGKGGSDSDIAAPVSEGVEMFKVGVSALSPILGFALGKVQSDNSVKSQSIMYGAISDISKTAISARPTPVCALVDGAFVCN